MPIPVVSFQPNTFEQSNPVLRGAQLAQQLYRGNIENAILPQMAQQELLAKQLANALSKVQVQYAQPMTEAELSYKQEMAPHLRAQTGLTHEQAKYFGPSAMAQIQQALANAGLTREQTKYFGPTALANIHQTMANTDKQLLGNELFRKTMPYAERNAQGSTYTDPILKRAYEMTIAQNSGEIPNQLLGEVGIGAQQQQNQPQSPYGNLSSFLGQTPMMQGGLPAAAAPKFSSAPSGRANWLMRGTPLSYEEEARLKAFQNNLSTEATERAKQQVEVTSEAAEQAEEAKKLKQFSDQFIENYKQSYYKGNRLGIIPSSGILGALAPGDVTPEQNADLAARNIQSVMAKMLGGRKLTNQELDFAGKLKYSRELTPKTAQELYNYFTATADRTIEHQRFMNEAIDRYQLTPNMARNLWSLYEEERPIFDFKKKKINENYRDTWGEYLTPEAIKKAEKNASRETISEPKNNIQEQSTYTPEDLEFTANKYGISVAEVKKQLGIR